MKTITIKELSEKVDSLGGTLHTDGRLVATFGFPESVSNDNFESITLQEAILVEKEMMELGFDGALIGHPLDESDDKYIYFELANTISRNVITR